MVYTYLRQPHVPRIIGKSTHLWPQVKEGGGFLERKIFSSQYVTPLNLRSVEIVFKPLYYKKNRVNIEFSFHIFGGKK